MSSSAAAGNPDADRAARAVATPGAAAAARPAADARQLSAALVVVILAAVQWLVFRQVLWHEFLTWDDDIHVTNNPFFQPVSWANVGRLWLGPYENLYIPVSYTFFAAEAWLSEQLFPPTEAQRFAPLVFHAGSLVLHLACAVCVFWLLAALVRDRAAALAGALLFSVHPLQVESVAWIGETRGLLSALGALVAMLAYLRSRPPAEPDPTHAALPSATSTAPTDARRRAARVRRAWFVAATGAFVLALLAKPAAAFLPLWIAALEGLWFGRPPRRWIGAVGLWTFVALIAIVGTKFLQADGRLAWTPPLGLRPWIALDALAFYLGKLALPVGLAFDYGRTPRAVLDAGAAGWVALVPLGVALTLALAPGRRLWLSGLALFVAALLPVLGFVPFLYQDISTVADRYAYLPLVGAALALSAWLARRPATWRYAAVAVVLGIWAQLSLAQAATWRDDATLYERGLAINPRSFAAYYSLGNLDFRRGETQRALRYFRRTLELHPRYARAHNNLGVCLAQLGRTDEAIDAYHAALQIDPTYAGARANLAGALADQGKLPAALREYREALRHDPRGIEARVNLALLLEQLGRGDEALAELRTAVELNPRAALAQFHLGRALAHRGQWPAAEAALRAALAERPSLAEAHDNLGTVLWRQGRRAEAVAEYEAALRLNPLLYETLYNLGLLRLEEQRVDEAVRYWRAAWRAAPLDSPAARQIEDTLRMYAPTLLEPSGPPPPAGAAHGPQGPGTSPTAYGSQSRGTPPAGSVPPGVAGPREGPGSADPRGAAAP